MPPALYCQICQVPLVLAARTLLRSAGGTILRRTWRCPRCGRQERDSTRSDPPSAVSDQPDPKP